VLFRVALLYFNKSVTDACLAPQLFHALESEHITADNIYNWDEKGCLIGFLKAMKRIMTQEAYKSGQVRQAGQDGSREFISLLAYVSEIGHKIPATLLNKGESFDLRDTGVEDLEDPDDFFFGASSNGWRSDAFGLQCLLKSLILLQKRLPEGRNASNCRWPFKLRKYGFH
jgi:hypothetical protein